MKKILFLFIALFVSFQMTTKAQDKATATYENGRLVRITNLISAAERNKSCASFVKIDRVEIAGVSAAGEKLKFFTVFDGEGETKVDISPSLFSQRLSAQDAKNLMASTVHGNQVSIKKCRDYGGYAFEIFFENDESLTAAMKVIDEPRLILQCYEYFEFFDGIRDRINIYEGYIQRLRGSETGNSRPAGRR